MKKVFLNLLMTIAVMSIVVFVPGIVSAAFSLSVSPYQGGYDLRFEKVSLATGRINREVTVNITSDIGKQYRVVQTLLDPLTNAQGKILPEGSFMVYGIRGSNKFGTLNVEQEVSVGMGRQFMYTSGNNGASDSFVLVYGLIPNEDFESGSYRGRIAFTLEPIQSTQSPVTVILTIIAEVETQPLFEIVTGNLSKEIVLKPDKPETGVSTLIFNIKGTLGKQFRVMQMVTEQPVSLEGEFLNWECVNFVGKGSQRGAVINKISALSPAQQVIYNSSSGGEADSFAIDYSLGDVSAQRAGTYKTTMKYFLEMPGADIKLIGAVTLIVENPRVFELLVRPEDGGMIRFTDVRPSSQSSKASSLLIEVKTNVGKQYQVSQEMLAELVNKSGDIIPPKFLKIREESMDTKGVLKFPSLVPLTSGESILFVSDVMGSPDHFKVIYELTPSLDIKAGDYSAKLVYSISEL